MADDRFNPRPRVPVKIIVCGSRDWTDGEAIKAELEHIHSTTGIVEVIHGDARGADKLADTIARHMGVKVSPFPADWRGKGRAAGHIRNAVMLQEQPDFVLAFKDGFNWRMDYGGTENMVKIALAAEIPTRVIDRANVGSR